MTELDIWLVDSFTDTPLTGNAASVVLDAEGLTDDDCRRISAEIGVSESAFVFPGTNEGADYRLRFFTPTQEVDLCGHATLAAFWVLATEGRIELKDGMNRLVQETCVGNLPIWVEAKDGKPERVVMGLKVPRFEAPEVNIDKLAAIFGVGRKQLVEDMPVEIVNSGLRSLHIPLAGLSGFGELKPLRRSLIDLSTNLDVGTIQVFCLEAEGEDVQAHCRVFAPALGIEEDPVTGTAAGALGAYVVRHGILPEGKDGLTRLRVEQGIELGRPGIVSVEVERDDEEFVGVRVGGRAVVSLKGKLRVSR
jgi:trans-2,3-dihydro-3-hydroxyanthranilate isomerase